jgi:hypothetical protein
MNLPQCLGQDICQLFFQGYVAEPDLHLVHALPDEMVAHINVLAPVMEDGISAQCNRRLIVDQKHRCSCLFSG